MVTRTSPAAAESIALRAFAALEQVVNAAGPMTLDELTMAYVHRVLERTGNNKKRTARLLGVDRRTIQRWLGEAQADDDDERKGS